MPALALLGCRVMPVRASIGSFSAVVLALGFAACTSKKGGEEAPAPTPQAPAEAAPAPTAPPVEAPPAAAEGTPGPSRPATIAVGGRHVCAIAGRGEVACWGAGRHGQLAPGVAENRATPVLVPGIDDAVSVIVGGDASCALRRGGQISCWGGIRLGGRADSVWTSAALGDVVELVSHRYGIEPLCGRRRDGSVACMSRLGSATPEVREIPGIKDAVALAGAAAMCALRANGHLECWKPFGLQAMLPTTVDERAEALAASGDDLCYAREGGELRCRTFTDQWKETIPVQGPLWKAKIPAEVWASAADFDSRGGVECLRDLAGVVSCRGNNRYGQLGNGTPGFSATPREFFEKMAGISVGGAQTCARTPEGTVRCQEQLLVAEEDPEVEGVQVLAAGDSHACAIVGGGQLRCWGLNSDGCLGVEGDPEGLVRVPGLSNAARIAVGDAHTCASLMDQRLFCWGNGDYAQLGNGRYSRDIAEDGEDSTILSSTPLQVTGISGQIRALALGATFTCATTEVGVYCWGQLPDPAATEQDPIIGQPRLVLAGGVGVIDAEGESLCVLDEGGAVRCWGSAAAGYDDVSDGGDEDEREDKHDDDYVPFARGGPLFQVGGIDVEVSDLAVGNEHACVVSTKGEVHCWGSNDEGQLGDGTTRERTMLTKVVGLANIVEIDAGSDHTCARDFEGKVQCWGSRTAPAAASVGKNLQPVRDLEAHVVAATPPVVVHLAPPSPAK